MGSDGPNIENARSKRAVYYAGPVVAAGGCWSRRKRWQAFWELNAGADSGVGPRRLT